MMPMQEEKSNEAQVKVNYNGSFIHVEQLVTSEIGRDKKGNSIQKVYLPNLCCGCLDEDPADYIQLFGRTVYSRRGFPYLRDGMRVVGPTSYPTYIEKIKVRGYFKHTETRSTCIRLPACYKCRLDYSDKVKTLIRIRLLVALTPPALCFLLVLAAYFVGIAELSMMSVAVAVVLFMIVAVLSKRVLAESFFEKRMAKEWEVCSIGGGEMLFVRNQDWCERVPLYRDHSVDQKDVGKMIERIVRNRNARKPEHTVAYLMKSNQAHSVVPVDEDIP